MAGKQRVVCVWLCVCYMQETMAAAAVAAAVVITTHSVTLEATAGYSETTQHNTTHTTGLNHSTHCPSNSAQTMASDR